MGHVQPTALNVGQFSQYLWTWGASETLPHLREGEGVDRIKDTYKRQFGSLESGGDFCFRCKWSQVQVLYELRDTILGCDAFPVLGGLIWGELV